MNQLVLHYLSQFRHLVELHSLIANIVFCSFSYGVFSCPVCVLEPFIIRTYALIICQGQICVLMFCSIVQIAITSTKTNKLYMYLQKCFYYSLCLYYYTCNFAYHTDLTSMLVLFTTYYQLINHSGRQRSAGNF